MPRLFNSITSQVPHQQQQQQQLFNIVSDSVNCLYINDTERDFRLAKAEDQLCVGMQLSVHCRRDEI